MRPQAPVSELVGQLAAAGMAKVLAGNEHPLLALIPSHAHPSAELQHAVRELTGARLEECPARNVGGLTAWLRTRVKRWAVRQATRIEFREPPPFD